MNSSAWYLHHPIDHESMTLLTDRQRTERATWLASLRASRVSGRR